MGIIELSKRVTGIRKQWRLGFAMTAILLVALIIASYSRSIAIYGNRPGGRWCLEVINARVYIYALSDWKYYRSFALDFGLPNDSDINAFPRAQLSCCGVSVFYGLWLGGSAFKYVVIPLYYPLFVCMGALLFSKRKTRAHGIGFPLEP
jgi:hypothetical protein